LQAPAQVTEFCRNFNFRNSSFYGCRRIHRCFKCNQPHPASSCTSFQTDFPCLSEAAFSVSEYICSPVIVSILSAFFVGYPAPLVDLLISFFSLYLFSFLTSTLNLFRYLSRAGKYEAKSIKTMEWRKRKKACKETAIQKAVTWGQVAVMVVVLTATV